MTIEETVTGSQKVDGKQFTSNNAKLLQHVDMLSDLKFKGIVRPVMAHFAPTNVCNLHCEYCCCGQRPIKGQISKEQIKSAMKQFRDIGVKGMEWTGGGDPTMHKDLNECTDYAKELGYHIGIVTNGISFKNFDRFKHLDWMRLSAHGFNEGKSLDASVEYAKNIAPDLTIGSVYIWTKNSETTIDRVAEWAMKYKIPTRVTPDLTLGIKSIDFMMKYVGDHVKRVDPEGKFLFVSDFNIQTTRKHHECYMHMVKPYVYADGNVYVCPSAELSPENPKAVGPKFLVCSIEDIATTYAPGVLKMRTQDCIYCKFAPQNELMSEIMTPKKHDNFA